jgi:3-dehydroquinate dehydratase-2
VVEKPQALRIGVLNGPNLNLLGQREPEKYGDEQLDDINRRLIVAAARLGVAADFFQSNIEGELVEWLQAAARRFDGLLVNAAGYTHTSVAIRDALKAIGLPFVEVHLTNVYAREPFRHHSYLSDIAVGLVAGFGGDSYVLALEGLVAYLRRP